MGPWLHTEGDIIGFSLPGLGKKIEDILGAGVHDVGSFLAPGIRTAENVLGFNQRAVAPTPTKPSPILGVPSETANVLRNNGSNAALLWSGPQALINNTVGPTVGQTASQIAGHTVKLPGIGAYPSFTGAVQQAHGLGGKALAVGSDVLNAAPVLGVAAKGLSLAAPALEDAAASLKNSPALVSQAGKVKLPGGLNEDGAIKLPVRSPQIVRNPSTGKTEVANTTGAAYKDYANTTKAAGVVPATEDQYNAAFKTEPDNFVPKRSPGTNTVLNPHKSDIGPVKQGDYGQVIANEQAASAPVSFAGDRWTAAMQNLQKTNPDEYKNFWRYFNDEGFKNAPKSPGLQKALTTWREVDNRIHGTSQALGGNTNYLRDHGLHPWNLSEEAASHIQNGGNPESFPGLRSISRKHATIAEGEAAGLKLGEDPLGEGNRYIGASSSILKRRAIVKGLTEADSQVTDKSHAFDIGGGESIPLSKEGKAAVRGLIKSAPSENAAIKGLRTANTATKSSILSLGQFHPINIAALRAAPTLALRGHPVAAAKGLGRTFGVLAPGGKARAEAVLQKALDDGMVDKAAKIGMPYGSEGFDAEGSFLKGGIGHKTVFGKQMPMMHDQVVRSIVSDLEKRGVPLDSEEARVAGKAGNNLMGFVNAEAQHIPPQVNRSLGDLLLAKQFTHSKFSQVGTALTKGGVGGGYARANLAANVLASGAIIVGLGALAKQKSDSVRDMLLRALVDPAAPTSSTDSKGNSVKLRLPGTDTSDLSKLLGIKLVRNPDGHLGVSWNPNNINPANQAAPFYDFARSRLAPWASDAVKVGTNTTFAGKPMFDPNAPAGTKAEQAATSVAEGLLPIGAQGLAFTGPVKDHAPGAVKEVLNAQTPETNPLVKSIGSSFGLTPSTDMTTGKGLESSRYFDALDEAKKGLNRQETDAIDLVSGSKKNPVTGKYDIQPSVMDSPTKANVLLQNSNVIDRLAAMNQKLVGEGQKSDPLWLQDTGKIKAYLTYQTINKNNTQQLTAWKQDNPWYKQLDQDRSVFFNSLPPGDPNKPKNPIQPPTSTPEINTGFTQYDQITDPTKRAQFLGAHPELTTFMDQESDYTNKILVAQGLTPLKKFPQADTSTASYTSAYMNGNPGQRSALKVGNPTGYKAMQAYLQNVDEYEVAKNGALDQLQGQTPNQALLKGVRGLGYDLVKNPDGTLALKYGSVNPGAPSYGSVAAPPSSAAVSASSGSGGGYSAARKMRLAGKTLRKKAYEPHLSKRSYNPKYAVPQAHRLAVSFSNTRTEKGGVRKPKVSLKRAMS